jgi:rhamnosyltransferase subunit B
MTAPIETLLVPVGSTGDVLPFLAIGRELRRRGGRVAVLANEWFAEPVRRAGLEFLPFGSRDEYLSVISARGPGALLRTARKLAHVTTDGLCDAVQAVASPRTILVSHTLAFGARIAGEKLGLKSVTAHLAPAVFDSAEEPAVLPGFFNSELRPRWYKRGVRFLFQRAADAVWAGPVRKLRGRLGLPQERPSHEGRKRSSLALFPDWFAPPQQDWPEDTTLTGFPLYDDPGAPDVPDDLAGFLDEGSAPIVFTPGSGQVNERGFFEVAIEASRRVGRRALLLTRFRQQLPAELPAHVRHAPFVPLGALLPRAAAIVHHGGIGTCAQALATGTPQLVRPWGFDQLDNAARLSRLGVGVTLRPRQFTSAAVERSLRQLLESPEVARRCLDASRLQQAGDAAAKACNAIERAVAN